MSSIFFNPPEKLLQITAKPYYHAHGVKFGGFVILYNLAYWNIIVHIVLDET
jgi:hypothetical protein